MLLHVILARPDDTSSRVRVSVLHVYDNGYNVHVYSGLQRRSDFLSCVFLDLQSIRDDEATNQRSSFSLML